MAKKAGRNAAGKELHDLFMEVFALHTVLSGVIDEVHERTGLSTSQHKIIRVLRRLGSATVPDMAAALGVSRQFVQTVCNDLLSRGYILFTDNPRHKRSKLAELTEPGHTEFYEAMQRENKIIEQAIPGIRPDKTREAKDLLASLRVAIERIPMGS